MVDSMVGIVVGDIDVVALIDSTKQCVTYAKTNFEMFEDEMRNFEVLKVLMQNSRVLKKTSRNAGM